MSEEIKKLLFLLHNDRLTEAGKRKLEQEIERLNKEVEKYKKRCYETLTLIRENYGLLDKYGIDMLDDILNGK